MRLISSLHRFAVQKMAASDNFMESSVILDFKDPSIYHDRVLIVGETRFYVSSGVLSLWSEYFRGLFNGTFAEADKKEIELKELDPENFEVFLKVLHNQELIWSRSQLVPLIDLAYRFLAPRLLQTCKEAIFENLKKMNKIMLPLLQKADEYGIHDLKKKLIKYVSRDEVMRKLKCPEIKKIVKEHKKSKASNDSSSDDFMNKPSVVDFRDPNVFHDRVLIVGKEKFYVVSALLSFWSGFFRSLFNENGKEFEKKEIKLDDLNSNELTLFLNNLYGQDQELIVDDLGSLTDIAHRFLTPLVLAYVTETLCGILLDIIAKVEKRFVVWDRWPPDDKEFGKWEDTDAEFVGRKEHQELLRTLPDLETVVVDLLEIAFTKDLTNLKTFFCDNVEKMLSFRNCSVFLDYAANLPDFKVKIIYAIAAWPKDLETHFIIQDFHENGEHIIDLVEYAFKEDIQVLKHFDIVKDLIPLIDLSYRFLAPNVLASSKQFIYRHIGKLTYIALELLDKACEYGISDLKKVLVDHISDESVLWNFSPLEVMEISVKYGLEKLKNGIINNASTIASVWNIDKFLECTVKYDMSNLRDKIVTIVADWDLDDDQLDFDDLTATLICAFEYNLQVLKDKCRSFIFQDVNLSGVSKNGHRITINNILKRNYEEIMELPTEIKDFIITSTFTSE